MKNFKDLLKKAQDGNEYWESRLRHSFAQQIITALSNAQMKRSEFARSAKISEAYLSRVLAGNENLSIKTIVKLARTLGLEVELNVFRPSPSFGKLDSVESPHWEAMSRALVKQHGSPRICMFAPRESVNEQHAYQFDVAFNLDETIVTAA